MTVMSAGARDARPPLVLVRLMNPIMRLVLRTRLGWLVRPFALLEFDGRRSGRRYRVPVGWHEIDGGEAVFTPAAWRTNFRGGNGAIVWYRGGRRHLTGALDVDPERVAADLQSLAERRGSLRPVGIALARDRRVTALDVEAVDRAVIRFASRVEESEKSAE